MQAYEAIHCRYSFDLPDSYRTLQGAGHFDVPPRENYLHFSDCEWLPLSTIASFEFNKWEIACDGGFVPFAITGGGEPYCWRVDWADGDEPPVVLCERCEWATCLAPDFRGFLYRMALEAFAGRNDFLGDAKVEELHRAVDIISPIFPAHWVRRLRDLRDKPWQKDEKLRNPSVISQQECEAIVAAELSFPHLNERFIHDKDFLKRSNRKR